MFSTYGLTRMHSSHPSKETMGIMADFVEVWWFCRGPVERWIIG